MAAIIIAICDKKKKKGRSSKAVRQSSLLPVTQPIHVYCKNVCYPYTTLSVQYNIWLADNNQQSKQSSCIHVSIGLKTGLDHTIEFNASYWYPLNAQSMATTN